MFLTTEDYTALIRNEIKDILLENYSEAKLPIGALRCSRDI